MADDMIAVSRLEKSFRLGLARKRVHAVRGISFSVDRGDIFGFLGPNGAGKTTTIKMLTGLIKPSAGSARLLGKEVPSAAARRGLGFLPENPYVYPFLTPREFVEMCGQLSGLRGQALRDRARTVLDKTSVLYAADRPARRLSKGMLQRTALAAALVADPELLILDEPMSGLDPVGRKEVKDLIVDERKAGRTIFFSTHILGDVETLCDRVVILRQGKIVVEGRLDDLLRRESQEVSIVLSGETGELREFCENSGFSLDDAGGRLRVTVGGRGHVPAILELALRRGVEVEEVVPLHATLEELFVREAIAPPDASREGISGPEASAV
jgi:ABC-2 type transport system ATP-binding protein